MSDRAKNLADRLALFNKTMMEFVENLTEEDWRKVCSWEDWPVGVTARHVGAGHYNIIGLVEMIVKEGKFPEMSGDQINQMANQHAREHAACTKAEVLDVLRKQGAALTAFVEGMDDAALDKTAYLAMMGKETTAGQFIELVVLQSGGEHLANMKAAMAA